MKVEGKASSEKETSLWCGWKIFELSRYLQERVFFVCFFCAVERQQTEYIILTNTKSHTYMWVSVQAKNRLI